MKDEEIRAELAKFKTMSFACSCEECSAKVEKILALIRTCVSEARVEADEKLHVPGEFICGECGFRLHSRALRASDGAVGIDVKEQKPFCPNDESVMRPLTWQESDAEASVAIKLLSERIDALEREGVIQ